MKLDGLEEHLVELLQPYLAPAFSVSDILDQNNLRRPEEENSGLVLLEQRLKNLIADIGMVSELSSPYYEI